MSKEAESAELILKLYDLRREDKMRDARNWFISFFPESVEDIMKAMIDPETSAKYRMVTSYWDMAASFVNHGAIDEAMFMASGGESWVVFCKVHPYVEGVRELLGSPNVMKHLEDLLMRQPNAAETLAARRESMKRWMQARADMARG
ncbi:MAG: hypothetical protein KA746_15995 [Pyrinomonadaceae bacterium]|nr:hypothetical protein [Pyrinomonadaceae bacterium]